MDIGELRDSFGSCTQEEIVAGCNRIRPAIQDWDAAQIWLWKIIRGLLDTNRYRAAARLLWGPELFDPRPKAVVRLLDAIENNAKVIVLGGGAQGKSYTVTCWMILDWLRDPEYTGVRIISTTASHALGNTFSSLQRFYDEAIVPLPGISQHGFIGVDSKDRHASISIIAIKQGDSGKTSLQGFHPIRRPVPHPVFGQLSRIRLFVDEGELVPVGLWRGVGNLLSNLHGKDTVKAICATNPWDVTSTLAANAEPPQGYNKLDIDRDKEWISTMGWKTIRLDPSDSENITEKKEVFPGLMTYSGYEEYRSKTGGNDPEYLCFARGFYATQGSIDSLIPLSFLDDFYGSWIFDASTVVSVGSVDLAFEGDDVVFFAGRYGKASAWIPRGSDIVRLEESRYVLQLDQFRTLPKCRTEEQCHQILKTCAEFGISTDWLCLDATGIGRGCADWFMENGHPGIMALNWSHKATHTKILDEDRCFADELYDSIVAELYFALRHWLEFSFIKCSNHVDMSKLQQEIVGRRRKRSRLGPTGNQMYGLESKQEFKKRYPRSPDRADALVQLLHISRIRGPERAQMAKRKRAPVATSTYDADPTNVTYLDFSQEYSSDAM